MRYEARKRTQRSSPGGLDGCYVVRCSSAVASSGPPQRGVRGGGTVQRVPGRALRFAEVRAGYLLLESVHVQIAER